MIETLLKPLIWFCEKTGRVLKITGTGPDTDVYLIRYYVIQSRWFNFFIHIFLRSDRDDMHDHPWDFGTYVVRGGYNEEVPCKYALVGIPETETNGYAINFRTTAKNRWATRKAEQLHRVKLPRDYSISEKDIAPMTVCFTGRTRRDWGFVKVSPNGQDSEWIFWKKYLGLPEDAPTRG